MNRVAALLILSCVASPAVAADKRPMTIDDLFRFQRVSDPQISPDGKHVVYVITKVDLANNSTNADLWLAATDGSTAPRQLTASPKHDRHPRWSPDGKRILFESNRGGEYQLWLIDPAGGEARQITDLATGATNAIWSRDGESIAFVSSVYPEYSDKPFAESNALNKKRIEEVAKNPVKARVFNSLFYRRFDSYVEGKREHLFVMKAPGANAPGSGSDMTPRDVTPGDRDAYPTSRTFGVGDDFTFSPDGKYLVFTAPPEKDVAWSTDYNLYRVPITGGKIERLTENKAADGCPRFSPDGFYLAYRAQKRAGHEADLWELMLVQCDAGGAFKGGPRELTVGYDREAITATSPQERPSQIVPFDLSVEEFVWEHRTQQTPRLIFTADEKATTQIFVVSITPGPVMPFIGPPFDSTVSSFSLSGDGSARAYLESRMSHPSELRTFSLHWADRTTRKLSANVQLLAELDLPRPESVTVPVKDAEMQMWVLKPPGFDPKKKWPLVYLVHGGPQSAWGDDWSYRWNPQLWAAQGYVVALPNPRGSTGFGQKFVDQISGDWGGKCYDDLMAGLAYLEKQPYIDSERMAAAGASFGGYMMNWFQGHTTKFKTLITHCGVYNFESMYGTTEELWFPEWDLGGVPWERGDSYRKFSPHLYAKNFKTPMLIIHNDLDFRVPVGEGQQLFTALQRQGVPSKFVNFPDEGHWVLKPQNSKFWHREVFAWLAKYAPPGGK